MVAAILSHNQKLIRVVCLPFAVSSFILDCEVAVFQDAASRSLVKVYRRITSARDFHHQGHRPDLFNRRVSTSTLEAIQRHSSFALRFRCHLPQSKLPKRRIGV